MQKAFEYYGDEIWEFGHKSGRRMNDIRQILQDIKEITKFKVSRRQFRYWLTYYLQFGHLNAQRKVWNKKKRKSKSQSFTESDDECLRKLIDECPQLYLDEFVDEMKKMAGKTWCSSTLWTRMHTLGYSLQVAVQRAKQADEDEQAAFYQRLNHFVSDPKQVLIIDETHKSRNASRRRRAWGRRGISPVVSSYFEEDFFKQYTLIGVANIFGFVPEACEIVERNENLDSRGTVDTERFEQFVEERLVPVLGNYELGEPNSIVIMDNAIIHMSGRIEEMINDAGAMLLQHHSHLT